MRQCVHARKGSVSNQHGDNDRQRPYAARATCDRPECIAAAVFWVQGETGESATYRPDPQG